MVSSRLKKEVLIIEDDYRTARFVSSHLHASGIGTHWINEGAQALTALNTRRPAVIIVDVELPGTDGFNLCKALSTHSLEPIVMVTASVESYGRLESFDLGVEDYIFKPFNPLELVFRIRAMFSKRLPGNFCSSVQGNHALELDEQALTASYNGRNLQVTPLEFRLLATLSAQKGRVFSREDLLDKAYPSHKAVTDRTVDSHIKNLRKKLKAIAPGEDIIQSIYGAGYKIDQASNTRC